LTAAVCGTLLLNFSSAATYVASRQAEDGQVAGKAATVDVANASGGRAVRFADSGAETKLYGTLQSSVGRLDTSYAAGLRLATMDLSWSRYETADGTYNQAYINELKAEYAAFRAKGMQVILGLGVQYPPDWLLALPNARYVNQYGTPYVSTDSGKKIGNMVFNQALRDQYKTYLQRLFNDLGTDFYAVRLGGWYGELNYPEHSFGGRTNCYWGFDPVAKGSAGGLAAGLSPNPVPSWTPGAASANHDSARRFADWYMESLQNYHDWQITTVRQLYSGKMAMMYPSWGVRPGQLDAAINADLNGSTSAEQNGEVQRGYDFARYVAGITDPNTVVYSTWIDAPFGNDNSTEEKDWRPIHWLSVLGDRNSRRLKAWGENTGNANLADMQFSFAQAAKYSDLGLVWAFEPQLYDGQHATIDQLAELIRQYR
jgi:hypothetical protein